MTTTIALVGAKGGSGTSTTAAALALHLARSGQRVDLVDESPAGDLAALMGLGQDIGAGNAVWILETLRTLRAPCALALTDEPAPWRIIDRGTLGDADANRLGADVAYLVTRPDYLALRRITRTPIPWTGVLMIEEPGRALGRSDVAQVLGVPVVAAVEVRASIARAIDAGVLPTRTPEPLTRYANAICRDLAHRGYPVPMSWTMDAPAELAQ